MYSMKEMGGRSAGSPTSLLARVSVGEGQLTTGRHLRQMGREDGGACRGVLPALGTLFGVERERGGSEGGGR